MSNMYTYVCIYVFMYVFIYKINKNVVNNFALNKYYTKTCALNHND